MLGYAGKFEYPKSVLEEISKGKYIDYMVIPRECYIFKFSNKKIYKLKPRFSFGENKEKWDLFLKVYADKCKF